MPVVDIPQLPVTLMTGAARPDWEDPVPPAPVTQDAPSLLGAAFRQSNSAVSALSSRTMVADNSVDPKFDVRANLDSLIGTKYDTYRDRFLDANNAAYSTLLKQQIDSEEADRATLAASPWMAFGASIGAMATDPIMYIPYVGEVAKGVEVGTGAVRVGIQAGIAGGLGTAMQESALQATQQTRPLSESLINIGMGTALTGFLGGVGYGLLSAGDKAVAARNVRNLSDVVNGRVDGITGQPRSAGAAAVDKPTIEDLSISGAVTGRVAKMTAINPVLRSYQRASATARDTLLNLYENTLYSARNERGLSNTVQGAAETEYKQLLSGRMQAAIREESDIFKQMKQSGINMSRSQFQDEIGMAMRRGDQGVNDFVSRAATVYRTKVMDTFKDDLIKEGQLPADVAPQDAVSYFSRMWNQKKLIAREGEFKDLIQPHIEQMLAEQHQKSIAALQANHAAIDQQLSDLKLSPADRAKTLADVKTQGAALDAANQEHVQRYTDYNDARKRAAEARKAQDYAGRDAALAEMKKLRAEGGDGYKAYRKARSELRARADQLGPQAIASDAREQALLTKKAAIEEANKDLFRALAKKAGGVGLINQTWAPAKVASAIEGIRAQFETAATQATKSAENLGQQVEKLRTTVADKAAKLEEMHTAEREAARAARAAKQPVPKPDTKARAALEKDLQADKRDLAALEATHKTQVEYATRLQDLHNRVEVSSTLSPDVAIADIKAASDEVMFLKDSPALSDGMSAKDFLEKAKARDTARLAAKEQELMAKRAQLSDSFAERWRRGDNIDPTDPTGANFSDFARSIVDEVFDKISGRFRPGEGGSALPDWVVPITKGPMKEKTFHIPDTVVEDYLHHNVRTVASRYARASAGEVTLSRRFGGDPTMRKALASVDAHYAELRNQINAAPNLQAALDVVGQKASILDSLRGKARGLESDDVSKERLLTWLENDRKGARTDIEAGRDMIRGTYKLAENNGKFGKFVQATNMLNYIRLSGGFVTSSISELYLSAFAHGLTPFLKDYARPLLTGLKGLKHIDEELHLAGLANEATMHGHLMSAMEIGDPFAEGNAFQRLLRNGTNVASKFNGMSLYQDFEERMAGRIGMQRLLKAVLKDNPGEKDAKWMAGLEVSGGMQERIARQFAAHGQTEDGIHVPNTEAWTDDLARDAFRNAMQKHVTTIVVKPGFGDLPLAARTPLGKMMLQFRTFSLAAHQRTTLRAMQEGPASLLSGVVGTTALGMMAAYISAARSGKDNFDKWMAKAEANPVWWIMEGVDRGGIIPLLMEGANNVEKVSSATGVGNSFNPIKTPISAAFGDNGGQSSRVASRDIFTTLLGPTAGLMTNTLRAAGAGIALTKGEDVSAAQRRAMVSLAPFGSFLGVKEALQFITGESPFQ